MKSITKLFLYLLVTLGISVQSSVQNEYSSFSVIGKNNVINKPGAIELGFKFALKDGWHTYWLNAGDSGGPAVFEYKNNSNLVISDITWPGPQKIPYPPLMTYGFKNDLVIPFKLTLNNLEDSQIEIKTKFLVCDDICVPQNDSFSLELKNGILNIKQAPNELLRWKSIVPTRGPPVKIVFPNQNGGLELISDQIDESSYFYPYMDGVIDYSVAQKISIKNQTQENSLALSMLDTFDGQISGVISSKNGFSEINETIKITPTVLESSLSEISLITALLFAFIGGLILNLMPCVLPVIALKAFSLIKNSQNSNSSITLNASLYVFGVLATFLGIAGSDGLVKMLKAAHENKNTKAIVLRVNSPGGSVVASEYIRWEIEKAQNKGIPIVVSMGSLAASGGYWVSSMADKIYAEENTITGSIGVYGRLLSFEKILEWAGLNYDSNKTTEFGDFNPVAEDWPEEIIETFQANIDETYMNFTTQTSKDRDIPLEKVLEIARGRVWYGEDAVEIGLVDEIGTLEEAINFTAESILEVDDFKVDYVKPPKNSNSLNFAISLTEAISEFVNGKELSKGKMRKEINVLCRECSLID